MGWPLLDDRAARSIQTKVDRGRLKVHVLRTLGPKPVRDIDRSDIEGIVEELDRKVQAGTLKWKSAANVWGLVTKAFDDAKNAKTRALRVRDDNPAADVRGPDRGEKTLKQYLYPSELFEALAHPDMPFEWARVIALGVYLYVRLGELEALEWEDLDLERSIIHVHRAINRESGKVKATKTDTPRKFPIQPALLPLLEAMHAEADGKGRVIQLPSDRNHARALRLYLQKAGLKRAELFATNDPTRKAITAYDLRATGITWRAVRGDQPLQIMSAAGHTNFNTTQGYIREAEVLRAGFGDVFPPLPDRLLDPDLVPLTGAADAKHREPLCRRRDLNHAKSQEKSTFAGESEATPPTTTGDEQPKPATPGQRSEIGANRSEADPVEEALATAIVEATKTGRFDVVAQLAKELEARRVARAGNVVTLDRERRKR